MTTMTIQQYNDIKKEVIEKYINCVWASTNYNEDIGYMMQSVKQDVFDKLDKRQDSNKRKGVPMIHLTTHGVVEG